MNVTYFYYEYFSEKLQGKVRKVKSQLKSTVEVPVN
jgi:hypothetical protein